MPAGAGWYHGGPPPRPMRRALPLALCLLAAPAAGQGAAPDTAAARYASSAAVALDLSEYGLGAGAVLRVGLGRDLSAVAELSVGAGRDEREQRFFVGFFGDTVTPFKRNYVVLVPLHAGLERRLFRREIEDNFRPFVSLAVGPTLAYQWPYFDDLDGDGGPRRRRGDARRDGRAGAGRAAAGRGRDARRRRPLRAGWGDAGRPHRAPGHVLPRRGRPPGGRPDPRRGPVPARVLDARRDVPRRPPAVAVGVRDRKGWRDEGRLVREDGAPPRLMGPGGAAGRRVNLASW